MYPSNPILRRLVLASEVPRLRTPFWLAKGAGQYGEDVVVELKGVRLDRSVWRGM